MRKKIIVVAVMLVIVLCSCAKREPAKSPASEELANKISEQFKDLNINIEEKKAEELFDDKNNMDFSKIENFAVRQSKHGEIGVFRLYTDVNADYIKEAAHKRILKLQAEACGLENLNIANNAEVRSYGNYVYYVSHNEKDKIFKIIEDELKGV